MAFAVLMVFLMGAATGAVIDNTVPAVHDKVSDLVEPNE